MRSSCVVRAGELGFTGESGLWGEIYRRSSLCRLSDFVEGCSTGEALSGALLRLIDPTATASSDSVVRILDIEAVAVGFGHLVAFLVGIGSVERDTISVDQLLLADPVSEAALLRAVADAVAGSVLLTYNGRAFDMRVLGSRCVANGIHPAAIEPRFHLDLLPVTRRLHRHELRSCTLRQAELRLLRYDRREDLAGIEGPSRYRGWLNGAPAEFFEGVVEHNRLDVCCTAALAQRLAAQIQGTSAKTTHSEAGARYNLSR